MYAQASTLHAPMNMMPQLRSAIEQDYLPRVREREGFISAHLLEQIDDTDTGLLIIYWRDQASVEAFAGTGLLEASVQALAARVPGVRIQREGYAVTVNVGSEIASAGV